MIRDQNLVSHVKKSVRLREGNFFKKFAGGISRGKAARVSLDLGRRVDPGVHLRSHGETGRGSRAVRRRRRGYGVACAVEGGDR